MRATISAKPTTDTVVTVNLVRSQQEAREAAAVLAQVWNAPGQEPIAADLAWVLSRCGSYVATARVGDFAVAASVAVLARDDDGEFLHSHVTGVLPGWRGHDIGTTLKHHQREWASAQALPRITWTFDPLARRNAHFNLVRLGARITGHAVDYYGPLDDGLNDGDETDRLVATVDVSGPRPAPILRCAADLVAGGAVVGLCADHDGQPVGTGATGALLLAQLPEDIVALRRSDPEMARKWRFALRQLLLAADCEGRRITGITPDGWYVVG